MCGVVRHRQVSVATGIPLIVIDPVQDSDQVAGATPQNPVEAKPERRRLDFLGILGTDRRYEPAEHDAGLEETDAPPVFERVNVHQVPTKPETRQPAGIEYPLIARL